MRCEIGVILAALLASGGAHAVPVSGQGTWETTLLGRDLHGYAVDGSGSDAVFLYDAALDVTWLRDVNYSKTSGVDSDGAMTWTAAAAWADNLTVGAWSDWRLPSMIDAGRPGCDYSGVSKDCGYNVLTKSASTVWSELAHLWYVGLGNLASIDASGQLRFGSYGVDFGFANTGDFLNVPGASFGSNRYWSGLAYPASLSPPEFPMAFYFDAVTGEQNAGMQANLYMALAVRPGDVLTFPPAGDLDPDAPAAGTSIPEPPEPTLFLAALAALVIARGRGRS